MVPQCLLLNAVDDDPSLDKVWYHVRALPFLYTNTSLAGFDCCLRVFSELVAQDEKQHFSEPAP